MPVTVGVAGISGKFARNLVSCLLTYPDARIKGLCRTASKVDASISSSPHVSLVQGDAFDTAALHALVRTCDVVVCCYLGDDRVMTEGQKALVDACEAENVPRYVASDWSLDYTKVALGELPPKDPMKRVKAYLEAGDKSVAGVHVLAGGFMEVLLRPMFFHHPQRPTFKYWGDGDEVFEASTYLNAAEFTAAVCMDPSARGVLGFIGSRASVRDIAATFEKVYGIQPKIERLGSLEELFDLMHAKKKAEPQNIYAWLPLFYYYYMASGKTDISPDAISDKYSHVKRVTWEDYMRATPIEKLVGYAKS